MLNKLIVDLSCNKLKFYFFYNKKIYEFIIDLVSENPFGSMGIINNFLLKETEAQSMYASVEPVSFVSMYFYLQYLEELDSKFLKIFEFDFDPETIFSLNNKLSKFKGKVNLEIFLRIFNRKLSFELLNFLRESGIFVEKYWFRRYDMTIERG